MRAAKIIALANQKGGVGKTTTCINLGASLAAMKRNVLVFDLDPQGNATMGSGVDKSQVDYSSFDVLLNNKPVSEVLVHVAHSHYDLVPSNSDLTGAEVGLLKEIGRELRLRNALEEVRYQYDYILLDCPPSLNMLTVNALSAATSVLIPVQCEYYALEGLSSLLDTIDKIKRHLNGSLAVSGLLRTMFDGRNNLAIQVSQQLSQHFGEKLFNTVIPRNVRLAEAPSHGLPALYYDKSSNGTIAYLALAGEVLRRDGVHLQDAMNM